MKKSVKTHQKNEKEFFFDKENNINLVLRIFYTLCALLFLMDFVVHRHIYIWYESIPAFYALYGFVACVVLVLIAKQMRKWLMRDEDYYQQKPDSESAQTHSEQGGD